MRVSGGCSAGHLLSMPLSADWRGRSVKGAQSRTWPVSCVFVSVARYGDAPSCPDREAALAPSKLAYLTLCRSIQLLLLL
jgi:hypothetical protein